jgi:FAD/FMN-containing dehydrogenase
MTSRSAVLEDLERRMRGDVVRAGESRYEDLRRTFNAMIDRRPQIIARPVDTEDVATAVRWAAEQAMPISVRGGGHSVAGHGVGDGALMLDLGEMRSVAVDPAARTAEVGGGALLGDLDRATTAYGLAAPSGTFSDTGVGGLTLTGGISFLLGVSGLACDALIGAEVVTANGSIHQVDEANDPDLLWALRGGGGNFGVVSRFRFALRPLESVIGGRIALGARAVPEMLERLFEAPRSDPDELTIQAVLVRREDLGGGLAVVILGAWVGDAAGADAIWAPFKKHPDVVEDGIGPMSYLDLQAMGARMGSAYRHYWKGHFVREAPQALIDVLMAAHEAGTSLGGILIEPIHGEAHRIPDDHAAFGARAAVANVSALAIWERPEEDERHVAWARATAASLEPYSLRGGGYLNYAPADETASRVELAFGPERFARLRGVKRRCDPDNLFRFNANIPPA